MPPSEALDGRRKTTDVVKQYGWHDYMDERAWLLGGRNAGDFESRYSRNQRYYVSRDGIIQPAIYKLYAILP
jgi:hypothetical protein